MPIPLPLDSMRLFNFDDYRRTLIEDMLKG
jgi:hypothetical protein